jgi:phosphoglycolate phosphatase
MQNNYSHIIWDWNGTLLDDVELCFSCINTLLINRGLPPIKDIYSYRDVFCFPVIDYYRRVGFDFDKEPFEINAAEFIALYHSDNSRFHLHESVTDVLSAIKNMGISQMILSASEINNLMLQIELLGVEQYFENIIGISNIYAESKLGIAQAYISEHKLDVSRIVLIGDTVHDNDVAKALGIDCILIANGHQNRQKLIDCGVPVLCKITDVWELLK